MVPHDHTMKNMLIVFFSVWFGVGTFVVVRWYRSRQPPSSGADGSGAFDGGRSDIPILPGHYQRTMWYFMRCFLGMVAGIGVFALGLQWESAAVQITGVVVAFISFLCMLGVVSRARSARCPSCSTMMAQGWDSVRCSSDGVFVCPQCKSRWRTRAVWGFD